MSFIKKLKSIKEVFFRFLCAITVMFLCHPALAADTGNNSDVVNKFLTESLKGLFGSGAGFWKVFILADIALATFAVMKSKNPMVFVGVFMTALVPGFLVKTYVF